MISLRLSSHTIWERKDRIKKSDLRGEIVKDHFPISFILFPSSEFLKER